MNKTLLKNVGATLITLLISINLLFLNLKPLTYNSIVYYRENARPFEYLFSDYKNVTIPDDVTVTFVKGVESLNSGFLDLWAENDNYRVRGFYRPLIKEITIVYNGYDPIEDILRHELAHHNWYYNLSLGQKQIVEQRHEEYCIGQKMEEYKCENPEEFYAVTIQRYGGFDGI